MGEWPVKVGGAQEMLTEVEVSGFTTSEEGGSGAPAEGREGGRGGGEIMILIQVHVK